MSANFNFYLNRQGAKGRKGDQGEQGYSPSISVETNTASEYVLKIQNEGYSFTTPNLRGNAIENTGGTYIRYNPDTEQMYTGGLDLATVQRAGAVMITPTGGIAAGGSTNDVPTSAEVYDYVESKITSIGEGYVKEEDFTDSMEQIASELDEKISFDNLASSLVAGSNITLVVDSEDGTITINSSGGDLSNYVTLNTRQTIEGAKHFLNNITVGISPARGTYSGNAINLKDAASTNGSLIADGQTRLSITKVDGTIDIDAYEIYLKTTGGRSIAASQIMTTSSYIVDNALSSTSYNPVQNRIVTQSINAKQDTISDLATIRSGAGLGSTSEQLANKVTSIDSTSTDTQYPSAKCVYDELETKADTELSNLSTNGNSKLHALKGYYEEFNQLNDIKGYSYYKNNLRTTFDKSKFTVVGSPVITDDGIASGFSSSSSLNTNIKLSQLAGKSWTIYASWVNAGENISPYENVLFDFGSWVAWGSLFFNTNSKRIAFYLRTGTLEEPSEEARGASITLPYIPDKIIASLSFDINTGIYTGKCDYGEGEVLIGTYQATTSNKELYTINTWPNNTIRIGEGSDNTYNKNATDLKQFSITVDGVEVSSGNKTGIDTYTINNSTISIPYIETIQGDRIADIQYLTQAQQIYEATGNCDEVILDQVNQVYYLPAGSIYGKINRTVGNIETLLNNINSGNGS